MYVGYSASGNGDGMWCQMENGEIPVDIDQLPQQGGDRVEYINKHHPACAYLWFQLLKTDLWQTAATEFPAAFQVDGGSFSSTSVAGDDSPSYAANR
jgi:hypothetical protein